LGGGGLLVIFLEGLSNLTSDVYAEVYPLYAISIIERTKNFFFSFPFIT